MKQYQDFLTSGRASKHSGFTIKDVGIQLLKEKVGSCLSNRDYELNDLRRINLLGYRKMLWGTDSRLRTYFFKIQRYGLLLFIVETIPRILGLKSNHKKLVQVISRIDDLYLH